MAQNFINGILIPEDGEPRRVALETDGRGLMGDALSRLVGGCFDTLPIVIPGVDLWGYQRSKVQIHGASELIRAHFNRLKPGVHDGS